VLQSLESFSSLRVLRLHLPNTGTYSTAQVKGAFLHERLCGISETGCRKRKAVSVSGMLADNTTRSVPMTRRGQSRQCIQTHCQFTAGPSNLLVYRCKRCSNESFSYSVLGKNDSLHEQDDPQWHRSVHIGDCTGQKRTIWMPAPAGSR
jgi:hypothetical protein